MRIKFVDHHQLQFCWLWTSLRCQKFSHNLNGIENSYPVSGQTSSKISIPNLYIPDRWLKVGCRERGEREQACRICLEDWSSSLPGPSILPTPRTRPSKRRTPGSTSNGWCTGSCLLFSTQSPCSLTSLCPGSPATTYSRRSSSFGLSLLLLGLDAVLL